MPRDIFSFLYLRHVSYDLKGILTSPGSDFYTYESKSTTLQNNSRERRRLRNFTATQSKPKFTKSFNKFY